jgi:polyisoprenoid-binding protein YceI
MERKIIRFIVLTFAGLFIFLPAVFGADFTIVPENSSIIFKIKHSNGYTIGFFEKFSGQFKLSDDNTGVVAANGSIDVASINTHNAARDGGLRSAIFFDADKFPQAAFTSTGMEGDKLKGTLTIKGKTNPIIFTVSVGAVNKSASGAPQATLMAQGKINRSDFGITFNEKLPNGQMLIGEEVELSFELEGVSQ